MRLLDQVIEGEDGDLVEQRGDEPDQRGGRERQAVDRQIAHGIHGILEPAVRPGRLGHDPVGAGEEVVPVVPVPQRGGGPHLRCDPDQGEHGPHGDLQTARQPDA